MQDLVHSKSFDPKRGFGGCGGQPEGWPSAFDGFVGDRHFVGAEPLAALEIVESASYRVRPWKGTSPGGCRGCGCPPHTPRSFSPRRSFRGRGIVPLFGRFRSSGRATGCGVGEERWISSNRATFQRFRFFPQGGAVGPSDQTPSMRCAQGVSGRPFSKAASWALIWFTERAPMSDGR